MPVSSMPMRARLLCGAALYFTAPYVYAQDAQPVISLDPIIVRQADDVGDSADRATSVYVADAELERARLGDLRDLFAGIANVSVGGAIPVAQKIFVNGVDMLNLTIAVDGILQNNRAFHHVSANVFDPGLLKSVRVDPGVAAADTGPNAVAGAVVMETVDVADILDEGDNFGGTARLGYSNNGDTLDGALTLAGRSEGFEILFYGRRATGDEYEDGDGNVVTGTETDISSNLLKFAYESDEGHRVELTGQRMEDSGLRNFRANFGSLGADYVRYDTTRSSVALNYENTQGNGIWDPKVSLGWSESAINAPLYEDSQGNTETFSAKFQNTFHLSERNTITAGLDYYDRTGSYQSDVQTSVQQETARNVGLFAQARFEPADRWKISTGIRYDFQDFDTVGADFSDSFSGASGNASITYEIIPGLTLRAGYSNVFGGLQIEDNYQYWAMSEAGFEWDYSNLASSRAQNINLGADWKSGAFTLGGELFKTNIDDVRDGDENFDVSTEGVNLRGTYGWDSGFARLTISHSEAERDNDAVSSYYLLDYAAPLGTIAAFEVQQELHRHNMLVGGSVDIAADYSPDLGSESGTVDLDGYEVLNLFAEYYPPALPGLTIRGAIQNVFDVDYSDRATYGGDYDGFSTLNEPGRTFVVQAIMKF